MTPADLEKEIELLREHRVLLSRTIRRLRAILDEADGVLDHLANTPTTVFLDRSVWFDA